MTHRLTADNLWYYAESLWIEQRLVIDLETDDQSITDAWSNFDKLSVIVVFKTWPKGRINAKLCSYM